jgi:hypothetical protein
MSYGGLGIGAVWGYLLGWLEGGPRHLVRTLLACVLTTALVGLETWMFAGLDAAWTFGLASLAFLLVHAGCRRTLRKIRRTSWRAFNG